MTAARFLLLTGFFALGSLAVRGDDKAEVSYYKDVRPIFVQHCQGCHQPAKAQGGFIMISPADMLKKGEMGDHPGLVPGKPGQSEIIAQVTAKDGKPPRMPKNRDPLLDAQVATIRTWIEHGAKDDSPASAVPLVDAAHPPTYELPPVVTALAYSPDGTLLAVSGYHEVLLYSADGSELVGAADRHVGADSVAGLFAGRQEARGLGRFAGAVRRGADLGHGDETSQGRRVGDI